MRVFAIFLLLPASCLLAQAPRGKSFPVTITGPDGKPIPTDKQPTVTMSLDDERGGGPDLATLPPDKVVMTIGDEKITAAALRAIIDALPQQIRDSARGQRRREFANKLVEIKLLAQEARRQKLDQNPAYQAQLAFQGDNLLAGSVYQSLLSSAPIDEKSARAWYEQHKGDWESVHARHILIRMKGSPVPLRPDQKDLTEEEALAKATELRKKVVGGADFATLAKTESDDTASGQKGGDLGFFGHGQMVPTFEQAAWALSPGQVSEPVKSQFGYHIIKLEERQAKPFEEVRGDVEKRMRPEAVQKTVQDMRNNTAVTLDPDFFGK